MGVLNKINTKSIKVRFLTTLMANLLRLGLSVLTGLLIARGLGPAEFGNFSFLLTSFASIFVLLDMGSSSAFYTFVSRKKRTRNFYVYYCSWVALQFFVALGLATVLLPPGVRQGIWLGHNTGIVVLALFASFGMNQLWRAATQAGESIRATVTVQGMNLAIASIHLLAILAITSLEMLSASTIFIAIILENAIFTVVLGYRIKDALIREVGSKGERFGDVLVEFRSYCLPLVPLALFSFVYTFADNWMLQHFGGAVEQGYYSVGMRIGNLSLIATTSMLGVFWKEIAEATERGDHEMVKNLFIKTSRALFFTGAVISCFLIPFSTEILLWLLGPAYASGGLTLAIMLLFPINQSLGQISGSFLLATGRTRLFRNMKLVFMAVSIPVTYFVLAPGDAFPGGLGLASVGLATKMVVMQAITVNVYIYVISRVNAWEFNISYQVIVLMTLLPLAYLSKQGGGWILAAIEPLRGTAAHLGLAGVIYLPFTAALLYAAPGLVGLRRDELRSMLGNIKNLLTPAG